MDCIYNIFMNFLKCQSFLKDTNLSAFIKTSSIAVSKVIESLMDLEQHEEKTTEFYFLGELQL